MKKQFIFLLCLISTLTLVTAIHDATVTVSPTGWLKTSTNYEFTFTITNNDATAGISQVMIMRPSSFSNLLCGDITGWQPTQTTTSCTWEATSSNKINQGQSKQFKLNITTTSNYGEYNWSIFTKEIFASTAEDIITTELQTIQAKINAANPGDTITIPAGTYNEDIIISKNNITLLGQDKTTTIIKGQTTEVNTNFPNAGTKGNSIATIEINANNVTITGLTIETPSLNDAQYAFGMLLDGSDIKIYNNIFNMKGDGGVLENPINDQGPVAIQTWTAANGGTNIKGLNISNNIFKEDNTNKLRKNGYYGIYLNVPSDNNASSNRISIKDNTFSGRIWRAIATEHSYVDIERNTITTTNQNAWNYGKAITLHHWSGSQTSINIIDNTISAGSEFEYWIIVGYPAVAMDFTDIKILSNTISSADTCIRITDDADKILLNNNKITNCSVKAVQNDNANILNATFNYWGTTILSEIQALISGNVDFDPWWYDAQGSADTTAPLASFLNAPHVNITNGSITITANTSDDRALDNYFLNFGDGQNTSGNFTGNHNLSATIITTHQYVTTGETTFTITLTIKDKTGNTKTITTSAVVNSVTPDWIVELKKNKMNMFSIPLMPNDTYYQTILANIKCNMDKIWSYQNGSWIYKTISSSCGWSSGNLQDIKPGYGYIIFMKEDDVLYGNGKQLSVETPSEVTLTTGWNLIGHYGQRTNLTATQALTSLELGNNYYWNSLLQINDNGQLESTNNPQPTKAYWISIKGIGLANQDAKQYFKYLPSQYAY